MCPGSVALMGTGGALKGASLHLLLVCGECCSTAKGKNWLTVQHAGSSTVGGTVSQCPLPFQHKHTEKHPATHIFVEFAALLF